jgi:hypothetical protein
LRRCEGDPEKAYHLFIENNKKLSGLPIMHMSELTRKLLANIRYDDVAKRRRDNYRTLENLLGRLNNLNVGLVGDAVPLTYPLLTRHIELRKQLIRSRIYTAVYWPNVIERSQPGSIEHHYASAIVHLPIDQRYCIDQMKQIAKEVKGILRS